MGYAPPNKHHQHAAPEGRDEISMILKRLYDEKLAQASYVVGCAATGEAAVVDPNRDLDAYVRVVEREGLRVTHVTETHIHADFVSGARELAERTGARLYLSGEGGEDWSYRYAGENGVVVLHDGDTFMVGNVRFQALHTPGHTPEHLSFLVTDTAGADRPMGAFTGDFIFVGSVGRPDLLETAVGEVGTMERAAAELYRSVQRFKAQPDYLQLWPAHGAGSACGKGLGSVPQTTLGYEKLFNWGLATAGEEEFVRVVLGGLPEPPRYFGEMKRINRDGPPLRGGFHRPARLSEQRLEGVLESGGLVIDTRPVVDYAAGHVPGTINIPLDRSFTTWAGWLVPYTRDFHVIVTDDGTSACIDEVVRDLALIGLDRVAGYFTSDAVYEWEVDGRELELLPEISTEDLRQVWERGAVSVLDVRSHAEWEAGHLPGVPNIPLGYLLERLEEVPADGPLVLQCESGGRSSIAASLLSARGIRQVLNYRAGYLRWRAAGLPVERDGVVY